MLRFHTTAALLVQALLSHTAVRAQFLPPGVLNPGAGSDIGDDRFVAQVIDSSNAVHVVWASQVDYTGASGTDPDIFYARLERGVWSSPELVNSYGNGDGAADERHPRLDWADGVVHVVWQSAHPFAGTGPDFDVFYARRAAGSWSPAQPVHQAAADSADDVVPNVVVRKNGDVIVAWQGSLPASADSDILWALRPDGAAVWNPAQALNRNAATDAGDDWGPVALAATGDGSVVAVWSTDDDFTPPFPSVGTDRDLASSTLGPPPSILGWASMVEVPWDLPRSDSGSDHSPAVAVVGSGSEEEVHVVWTSNEDEAAAGFDYDVFHTVLGNFDAWPASSYARSDRSFEDDTDPALCVEPGGVLHLVWHSNADLGTGGDTDVYHATNATSGPWWSPAEVVGLKGFFDGPGHEDLMPRVACAPNGTLSVVWDSNDDLNGTAGNDFDILHSLGLGLGVSRPRPINPSATSDGGLDWGAALAVDSKNVLHAVWFSRNDQLPGSPGIGTDDDILYARLGPDGWTGYETVNAAELDAAQDVHPDLAIDAADRLHVVWATDDPALAGNGQDFDVVYAVRENGVWTAPELVNASGGTDQAEDTEPAILLEADGTPHVVWRRTNDQVRYARRSAAGWSEELINGAAVNGVLDGSPGMALDTAGQPHVVWSSTSDFGGSGTDLDVFYSERTAGSWSAPQPVGMAVGDAATDWQPAIAFGADGELWVVWASNLDLGGAGADYDLLVSRGPESAWAPQVLLELAKLDSGNDGHPALVFGRNRLHVAWETEEPLGFGAAGTDRDIAYTAVALGSQLPVDAPVLLANATGWADFSLDFGPDLVIDRGGVVHLAWKSDLDLLGRPVTDLDVHHAYVPSRGPLFADGFESGDTRTWSLAVP